MTLSFERAVLNIGREAARWVLPSPCVVCGSELPWRARVGSCCLDCWNRLPVITEAKCGRCAIPIPAGTAGQAITCIECSVDPPSMEFTDSWGHYRGGLERVLHAFKFGGHDFLDRPLATLLAELWDRHEDHDFDVVAGVPLHANRRRARGYDQAERLARHFARRAGLEYSGRMLERRIDRQPQSKLDRAARLINVRGVYAGTARAGGRSILLIDDICTTGATLRACTTALLSAGARRVAAITIARA